MTVSGARGENTGVGYKVIPVNPGTADVTPQLEAAVSWGAKAIGLTGDVTLKATRCFPASAPRRP